MARSGSKPKSETFDASGDIFARVMDAVHAVRQNHAMEHATLAILAKRLEGHKRIVGRAGWDGFYLYGDVPTDLVADAAREAMQRLQEGERDLAISANCGTNIVVAGLAAGVASMIVARGHTGSDRLTRIILASTIAVLLAQPLGKVAQRHITTTSELDNVSIARVVRTSGDGLTVHKVELARL
ncbi:MAG: hypothetical protein FJZ95_03495 [Chloroflexi bacterium]|nr:hypothetical protein [Chloroflexota bacterium]